jgi:hypothetical protein
MKTQTDNSVVSKVGRPKKQMKKDQRLTLVCTLTEKLFISKWAKEKGLAVSDYLRMMALIQNADTHKPEFSREARPLLVRLDYLIGNLKEMLDKEPGTPFTALKLAGIKSILQQVSLLQTSLMPYTN